MERIRKRGTKKESENEKTAVLHEMAQLLVCLLRVVAALGLTAWVFGPNFVRLAINLFLASQWRREEMVQTLSAFCLNGMLALNGVSEAFVYALADGFAGINFTLGISSVVYVVVNYLLYRLHPQIGTAGVVFVWHSRLCRPRDDELPRHLEILRVPWPRSGALYQDIAAITPHGSSSWRCGCRLCEELVSLRRAG